MTAATEGSLPPVMPQGNLVEFLGREVRQGSPGELMVESSPSRQRRPPCKTNTEMSDEAADAAALTYPYSLTYSVFWWISAAKRSLWPTPMFLETKSLKNMNQPNGGAYSKPIRRRLCRGGRRANRRPNSIYGGFGW